MGIAALILSVLGLVAVALGMSLNFYPPLAFGGSACLLAGFVMGLVGRKTGAPARAGMVLGGLGVAGIVLLYGLFMRSAESGPVEAPASETVAPPVIQ